MGFRGKLCEKWNNRRGFTVVEVVVVVAIVAILMAVAMPGAASLLKKMKMRDLDDSAKAIFLAAQNKMVSMNNSGDMDGLPQPPSTTADGTEITVMNQDEAAEKLLPPGSLESKLSSNYYYIVYDQDSASVLDVFYAEKQFVFDYSDAGKSWEERYELSPKVGYYGGNAAGSETTMQLLPPAVTIDNGEKLIATISVKSLSPKINVNDIHLEVTINGKALKLSLPAMAANSNVYTVVLDSLADGEPRFQSLDTGVAPGENFTLTATVNYNQNTVLANRTSVTANSLFDNDTSRETAVIGCGRHLQNLAASSGVTKSAITKAVQKADIHFDDTDSDVDWNSYYEQNGVSYQPVINGNIESYDGQGNAIIGLTVAGADNAGLFGVFSGSQLKNIHMVNAQLDGGNVGALAGRISSDAEIIGCRVYHAYEDQSVKDALGGDDAYTNYQLTGQVAGGLVGISAGANVSLTGSFAAVLAEGKILAGGLIGQSGSVAVESSYADCYLQAPVTGGLIGSAGGEAAIASCYSSGFATPSQAAAGLIGDTSSARATVRDSYSSMFYLTKAAEGNYALVKSGEVRDSYYLNASNIEDDGKAEACTNTQLKEKKIRGFSTGGETRAYNLMPGMALTVYDFPRLKDIPHYGDWKADFESGILVYYERYAQDSSAGDGTGAGAGGGISAGDYGFYGSHLDRLQSREAVLDGFGIIYSEQPTEQVTVTCGADTAKLDPGTAISFQLTVDGLLEDYYLLPLPAEVFVNRSQVSGNFYQEIAVSVPGEEDRYGYNPHFAKTVVPLQEGGISKLTVPAQISVRTARHLNALSVFGKTYAHQKWTYIQELNVNYKTYRWTEAGFPAAVTTQLPIGASEAESFNGRYNGQYDKTNHIVSGVSLSSSESAIGLFGYNEGTIRNLIFDSNSTVRSSAGITGRSTTVYMGGFVGKNSGVITGCATAHLDLSAANTKNSTVYMGGFAGWNEALIRQSTSACDSIVVDSTQANSFVAAFIGTNDGTIQQCYATGAVRVSRDTRGDVFAAGFAGRSSGTIQNSYCATGLFADGAAEAYAFSGDATAASNYYLSDGSFTFGGHTYALTYKDAENSGAKSLKQLELSQLTLPGFQRAEECWKKDDAGNVTDIIDSEHYPYPRILGQHYGDWVKRLDVGDVGVCYWEYEEGGTNPGYHFYYVGVDTNTDATLVNSTLCSYHDDGGVITQYGYGYFCRQGETASLVNSELYNTNNNRWDKSTAQHADVQDALRVQMDDKYQFTAYVTWDASKREGLYPQGNNTDGNWTVQYRGKNYVFRISPFFAGAVQRERAVDGQGMPSFVANAPGTADNSYGVRSVHQLQYINWNSSNKNCTTVATKNTKDVEFAYLNNPSNTTKRYWRQGHDIDGRDVKDYVPIAGNTDVNGLSQDSGSTGTLYSWFGGSYHGQDYRILELSISSPQDDNSNNNVKPFNMNTMGLFGTVVGGNLEHIIMFSPSGDATISIQGQGWYALGGLVGLAASSNGAESTIANCSISGYQLLDQRGRDAAGNPISGAKVGLGGAGVGGLIGICSMSLSNCTAVTDIILDYGYSDSGRQVRTGGLTGTCLKTIENCYAGGRISVTNDAKSKATNIRIGGMMGGCYMKPLNNKNGNAIVAGATGGTNVTIKDSYCFTELPERRKNNNGEYRKKDTFYAVGGKGDSGSVNVVHAYYLEENILKNNVREALMAENWNESKSETPTAKDFQATAATYEMMADLTTEDGMLAKLNAGKKEEDIKFGIVTNEKDGVIVDGKYSYPVNTILKGQNYPFPTILTREENGVVVNLHYGDWPQKGILSQTDIVEVDLLADKPAETSVPLTLSNVKPGGRFSFSVVDGSDIADIEINYGDTTSQTATMVVRGKKVGFADVIVRYTVDGVAYDLEMEVAVTAQVIVKLNPANAALPEGGTLRFTAEVTDAAGSPLEVDWNAVQSNAESVAAATGPVAVVSPSSGLFEVKGYSQGDGILTVTAVHERDGKKYQGSGLASVTVVPVAVEAAPAVVIRGEASEYTGEITVTVNETETVNAMIAEGVANVSDQAVVEANISGGKLSLRGLAEGETTVTIPVTYTYGGQNYEARASIAVSVLEPRINASPSQVNLTVGSDGQQKIQLHPTVGKIEEYQIYLSGYESSIVSLVDFDKETGIVTLTVDTSVPAATTITVTATRTTGGEPLTLEIPITVTGEVALLMDDDQGLRPGIGVSLVDAQLPLTLFSGETVDITVDRTEVDGDERIRNFSIDFAQVKVISGTLDGTPRAFWNGEDQTVSVSAGDDTPESAGDDTLESAGKEESGKTGITVEFTCSYDFRLPDGSWKHCAQEIVSVEVPLNVISTRMPDIQWSEQWNGEWRDYAAAIRLAVRAGTTRRISCGESLQFFEIESADHWLPLSISAAEGILQVEEPRSSGVAVLRGTSGKDRYRLTVQVDVIAEEMPKFRFVVDQ